MKKPKKLLTFKQFTNRQKRSDNKASIPRHADSFIDAPTDNQAREIHAGTSKTLD